MKQTINNIQFGDFLWNYLSIIITAVSGVMFSVLISLFYSESVLGRFNTIYSYYIVLSQFSVCGIHMAVVRYTSEFYTKKKEASAILCDSIVLTVINSSLVSILGYIIVNCVLIKILGEDKIYSINTIWVALIFFSINKVFLGWLNGCSKLKAYAFFQGSRNILIVMSLSFFVILHAPGYMLTFSFLFAEGVLFVLEMIYSIWTRCFQIVFSKKYVRQILNFAIRIFPSNAVIELNSKIDVVCLAFIIQDEKLIGIYSFAAMFGEGFYQIFIVIRRIINPNITVMYMSGKLDEYVEKIKKQYMVYLYSGGSLVQIILCTGYCMLVLWVGKRGYLQGVIPLFIICSCIVLNAKALIYGNILAQTGNPAEESISNIASDMFNGIANIIFIRQFGIIGAAVATGLSYCIYNWIQRKFVSQKLKLLL